MRMLVFTERCNHMKVINRHLFPVKTNVWYFHLSIRWASGWDFDRFLNSGQAQYIALGFIADGKTSAGQDSASATGH